MSRSICYPMLALIRGLTIGDPQGSKSGFLDGKARQSTCRGSRLTPQPARSLLLPSRSIVTEILRLLPSTIRLLALTTNIPANTPTNFLESVLAALKRS